MKNKLVLIFDSQNKVNDIPSCLIFNNEKDMEEYFTNTPFIRFSVDWDLDMFYFIHKSEGWKGQGKIYWGKEV